jgi:hypothetical protein
MLGRAGPEFERSVREGYSDTGAGEKANTIKLCHSELYPQHYIPFYCDSSYTSPFVLAAGYTVNGNAGWGKSLSRNEMEYTIADKVQNYTI